MVRAIKIIGKQINEMQTFEGEVNKFLIETESNADIPAKILDVNLFIDHLNNAWALIDYEYKI